MTTQQEILDVLRRARERIADPVRWCRGALALDQFRCSTRPDAPGAVAWCALGALGELTPGPRDAAYHVLVQAADAGWRRPISAVNDALGHAAVLALYDRAIADAQAAVTAADPA